MTEIERKALALVNEAAHCDEPWVLDDVKGGVVFKALCRAIEQHEAFRREVSDAVKCYIHTVGLDAAKYFGRFIIPKPDPLVEVLDEMGLGLSKSAAEEFRAAMKARGYEWTKIVGKRND